MPPKLLTLASTLGDFLALAREHQTFCCEVVEVP